jgi:hypothetical protein
MAVGDAVGQDLARSLAAALAEPSVRVRIRNAMRLSPHFEHKLLLQEFIDTNDGRFFLAATAKASGTSVESLRASIAKLPPMDFYVPVTEHRLNWRGGADVVLGLNMDVNDFTLTGYTPGGGSVQLDSRNGVPARTVLILHPAEPRMPGVSGSRRPGETIQDADEPRLMMGEESMAIEPIDCVYPESTGGGYAPVGDEEYVSPTCGGGGGGGGGGTTVPPKYLRRFVTYVYDGWGSAEVKFFMWRQNWDGSRTKLWDWRIDGINPGTLYTPNKSFTSMGSYATVEEMDSWFTGNDDYWGESYASSTNAVNGWRGFAPSGQWTMIFGACGPVYVDGNWRGHCGSDGSSAGDFYAWHRLEHTVNVVFEY